MEQLAPECLAMLVGIEGPQANLIPITNTLLGELQRRGVSRDQLLTTLQQLGAAEFPAASVELLRHCQGLGVDVKILSDCNSVFISHILAGAKAINLVAEVLTNSASFEWAPEEGGEAGGAVSTKASPGRAPGNSQVLARGSNSSLTSSTSSSGGAGGGGGGSGAQSAGARLVSFMTRMTGGSSSHATAPSSAAPRNSCGSGGKAGAAGSLGHRLVIRPFHGQDRPSHQCPLCPDNLCKGTEVRSIRRTGMYRHIIYAGDGMNDVCAALALGPHDHVLVRHGHALDAWLQRAAAGAPGTRRPDATLHHWSTHEELSQLVRQLLRQHHSKH